MFTVSERLNKSLLSLTSRESCLTDLFLTLYINSDEENYNFMLARKSLIKIRKSIFALRKIKKNSISNRVSPAMMITRNFHPFSINTKLTDLTDLTIITPNYTALSLIVENEKKMGKLRKRGRTKNKTNKSNQ